MAVGEGTSTGDCYTFDDLKGEIFRGRGAVQGPQLLRIRQLRSVDQVQSSPLSNELIPNYEIMEKIGRGKYSDVFKCINVTNDKLSVLKILKPGAPCLTQCEKTKSRGKSRSSRPSADSPTSSSSRPSCSTPAPSATVSSTPSSTTSTSGTFLIPNSASHR